MASIAGTLERIKDRPLEIEGILDAQAVERVFTEHGYEWRQRTLGPAQTIELFIRQVLEGNESCACVRQRAGGAFTAGAYCQARSRLPLAAVWGLCGQAWRQLRVDHQDEAPRWHGHRTFQLDGTSFSMPDTPELQETFGQPGQQRAGCGFPVAHLLVSFDAGTGMLLEAIPAPLRTHDLRDVQFIHRHLQAGDILIGDKAFGSWAHLALLQSAQIHGLFPLHQHRPPRAGNGDGVEVWPKPPRKPDWLDQARWDALPGQLTVRIVCRTIRRRGFRPLRIELVTTLLEAQEYPAAELVELAKGRWSAELNIRHLKTTMGLEVLKCQSVQGVLKELAIFCLVYNLVRAVMLKASAAQHVEVDRISFADALDWIRCTEPGASLWKLIVNPLRQDRVDPRAIKRRPKPYDLMNQPRAEMRKALKNQAKAA
jgi:hypothetical protein